VIFALTIFGTTAATDFAEGKFSVDLPEGLLL